MYDFSSFFSYNMNNNIINNDSQMLDCERYENYMHEFFLIRNLNRVITT